MAFTLNQYSALCAAIASGQLRVRYDGKEVEYRSVAELLKAKAVVEAELIASGQLQPPTTGGIVRGGTTWASYDPC